jgi:hypothetical protein
LEALMDEKVTESSRIASQVDKDWMHEPPLKVKSLNKVSMRVSVEEAFKNISWNGSCISGKNAKRQERNIR